MRRAVGQELLLLVTPPEVEVERARADRRVDHGPEEGGAALGLSFIKIFFIIILPQAYRYALGPTVGFLVQIIKGTSLAYIIGFQDLMLLGKRWANSPIPGSEPYLIFPLMALIYFALCFPLSKMATFLEKKHSL